MMKAKQAIEILQELFNEDDQIVVRFIGKDIAETIFDREVSEDEWSKIGNQLDYELDEAVVELDVWHDYRGIEA